MMSAIASTRDRVPSSTAHHINERIRHETEDRLRRLEGQSTRIAARLHELDEEWDVERAIEANASTLAFVGVALGFFAHPYWLILPALVTAFLFQHAIQGWCPPIPILRRLGFRTSPEIEQERQALKVLRGDFENVAELPNRAAAALAAAEL